MLRKTSFGDWWKPSFRRSSVRYSTFCVSASRALFSSDGFHRFKFFLVDGKVLFRNHLGWSWFSISMKKVTSQFFFRSKSKIYSSKNKHTLGNLLWQIGGCVWEVRVSVQDMRVVTGQWFPSSSAPPLITDTSNFLPSCLSLFLCWLVKFCICTKWRTGLKD